MENSGLILAHRLYAEHGKVLLERRLPSLFSQMACGLVGEGSECFGFDDEFSRDHDWGPAFCMWLPQDMVAEARLRVNAVLSDLPQAFEGFPVRLHHPDPQGRIGVLGIESFYARFTGLPTLPQHWHEWRAIPEPFLAVCTNGAVFDDALGVFSTHREHLLDFYPRDVWLKKLAARCAGLAQTGQYNLPRTLQRHDTVTVALTVARATEQVISLIFLLNRRYMPFYKWAFRALSDLPILGKTVAEQLKQLMEKHTKTTRQAESVCETIEHICSLVVSELQRQDLSHEQDTWLMEHATIIQSQIETKELRTMPVLSE